MDTNINALLDALDVEDVNALAEVGAKIRMMVMQAPLPDTLNESIREAYASLNPGDKGQVAVRSSATAEDLPEASFAGQQESFLNIAGIDQVLAAVKEVFASLFNDRAIAYRVHQGFAHAEVALSAGIQRMVRSDQGASGVMFTIDTESGFQEAVFVTSSWGLGECVVQGSVNPDEFYVYKPALKQDRPAILRRNRGSKLIKMVYTKNASEGGHHQTVRTVDVEEADQLRFSLSDQEVTALANMAVTIESHYGRPMDIEWGKDGVTSELMILQARPETVESRANKQVLERFQMNEKGRCSDHGAKYWPKNRLWRGAYCPVGCRLR